MPAGYFESRGLIESGDKVHTGLRELHININSKFIIDIMAMHMIRDLNYFITANNPSNLIIHGNCTLQLHFLSPASWCNEMDSNMFQINLCQIIPLSWYIKHFP